MEYGSIGAIICFLSLILISEAKLAFVAEPLSQALLVGDDLQLDCLAFRQHVTPEQEEDTVLLYQWYHNHVLITDNQFGVSFFTNHSLFISELHQSLLGSYYCTVEEVEQDGGFMTSRVATIVQAYQDDFIISPQNVTTEVNTVVIFTCVTGPGAPPPLTHWTLNNQIFTMGKQMTAMFGSTGEGGAKQYSMKLELLVSIETSGDYNCVAVNTLTQQQVVSQTATLALQEGIPYIEKQLPQHVTPTANQPYLLDCPITAIPSGNITWYKGEAVLEFQTRLTVLQNDSLYFNPILQNDAGMYSCRYTNEFGSITADPVNITTAYLEANFGLHPPSQLVLAGQDVTLPCIPPKSNPPPVIVWYKNDSEMMQPGHMLFTYPGSTNLVLSDIQYSDHAYYHCVAYNHLALPQSRESSAAHIIVYGSPVITQPPIPVTLIKNEALYLVCLVNANPKANITWWHDEEMIQKSERISFWKANQDMNVRDVKKHDEGLYKCEASNDYGTTSSQYVPVNVLVPPEITEGPADITAVEGDNFLLTCTVYGDPTPTITWYKDGVPVQLTEKILKTSTGLNFLIISSSDEGVYRCEASNKAGNKSRSAKLTVDRVPVIASFSGNQIVNSSSTLLLYCHFSGRPTPSVSWRHNSNSVLPNGVVPSPDNLTLIIHKVEIQHRGVYTCVANNLHGTANVSFTLTVQERPIISELTGESPVNQGATLKVSCQVTGSPAPSISWWRDEIRLMPSLNGRISFPLHNTVWVQFATAEDAGIYKCVASNPAGTEAKSLPILIIGTPLPPHVDVVYPLSTTSLNMSWTLSEQNIATDITSFVIEYKLRSSLVFDKSVDDITPSMTSLEVTGLIPATEYSLRIAARNAIGTGQFSAIHSATTWETAPTSPQQLSVVSSSAITAHLQWEIPDETNGIIRLYQLQYKPKFSNSAFVTELISLPSLPLQQYVIENLQAFTTYEVRVRAATIDQGQNKWGVWTDAVTFTTSADVPSTHPEGVQLKVWSHNVIEISWQELLPQDINGVLSGYKIVYRIIGTEFVQSLDVGSDTLQVNLTNLFPWRYYQVQVQAYNAKGNGPASHAKQVRTKPTAPSAAPLSVKVTALSSTSIYVAWQAIPAEMRNSDLSGYIVHYKKTNAGDINSHYTASSIILNSTIRDLTADTEYDVSVQGYTTQVSDGYGPITNMIIVRTLHTFPGPVENVSIEHVGWNSVVVGWQSAESGGDLYYIIFYWVINESIPDTQVMRQRRAAGDNDESPTSTVMNVTVSPNTTSHRLTGLIPDTQYQLVIAAVSPAGMGPTSNHTIHTDVAQWQGSAVTTQLESWLSSPVPPRLVATETQTEENTTTEDNDDTSTRLLVGVVFAVILGAILLFLLLLAIFYCLCHQRKCLKRSLHDNHSLASSHSVIPDVPGSSLTTSAGSTQYTRKDSSSILASSTFGTSTEPATSGMRIHERDLSQHAQASSSGSLSSLQRGVSSHQIYIQQPSNMNNVLHQSSHDQLAGATALSQPPTKVRSHISLHGDGITHLPPDMYSSFHSDLYPYKSQTAGIDNPSFEWEGKLGARFMADRQSTTSLPPVFHSSQDLHTQMTATSKRRHNRMEGSAAAAIAAQRNYNSSVYGDTDSLLTNDSVVVYDERTAL